MNSGPHLEKSSLEVSNLRSLNQKSEIRSDFPLSHLRPSRFKAFDDTLAVRQRSRKVLNRKERNGRKEKAAKRLKAKKLRAPVARFPPPRRY